MPIADHFYTTSATERDTSVANHYKYEGIACYVYTSQTSGTTPFYRLHNPNGDHFYTASATERDNAVAEYGYKVEGVACYVHDSQVSGTTPFYRLFIKPVVIAPTQKPPDAIDRQTYDSATLHYHDGQAWWRVSINAFKNNYLVSESIGTEVEVYRWEKFSGSTLWRWVNRPASSITINNSYTGEKARRWPASEYAHGSITKNNVDYLEKKVHTVLEPLELDEVNGSASATVGNPASSLHAKVRAP